MSIPWSMIKQLRTVTSIRGIRLPGWLLQELWCWRGTWPLSTHPKMVWLTIYFHAQHYIFTSQWKPTTISFQIMWSSCSQPAPDRIWILNHSGMRGDLESLYPNESIMLTTTHGEDVSDEAIVTDESKKADLLLQWQKPFSGHNTHALYNNLVLAWNYK